MQYSISALIATLPLCVVILPTAAYAQTTVPVSLNPSVVNQVFVKQLNPFNLAYLAYQGYLKNQGIPGYGALLIGISSGEITAQNIIQAAVKVNLLPEQSLRDESYRDYVEDQLKELTEE